MNKHTLIGRLGGDPADGKSSKTSVAFLSVATNFQSYIEGEKKEEVMWNRIVTFGKTADFCLEYLKKGDLVYVEGELVQAKTQDKQGFVFLQPRTRASRVLKLTPSTPNENNKIQEEIPF